MTDAIRTTWGRLTLLIGLALLAGMSQNATASCPPGYSEVLDCSNQDAHRAACNRAYWAAHTAANRAYLRCSTRCSIDLPDTAAVADCVADCAKARGSAETAALVELAICRANPPACRRSCVKDSSHPRWWCPLWPDCPYARATPRDPPTPVKALTARDLAPEVRLRTDLEGSLEVVAPPRARSD